MYYSMKCNERTKLLQKLSQKTKILNSRKKKIYFMQLFLANISENNDCGLYKSRKYDTKTPSSLMNFFLQNGGYDRVRHTYIYTGTHKFELILAFGYWNTIKL